MEYKAYPKAKDVANRKTRKSQRNSTFVFNRKVAKLAKRPRNISPQAR